MTRSALALMMFVAIAQAGPAMAQDGGNVDCANAQVQVEMTYCAEQDFDAADAELNQVWKQVKRFMEQADRDIAEDNPDQVGAVDALLKAQRAWIDYRDGQCEAYGFQARGGSMEPMLIMGCKAELTRTRTRELQSLMSRGGE